MAETSSRLLCCAVLCCAALCCAVLAVFSLLRAFVCMCMNVHVRPVESMYRPFLQSSTSLRLMCACVWMFFFFVFF